MIDFDSLDKVTNTICKINSTLSIKHVIQLREKSSNRVDARINDHAFYYNFPVKSGTDYYGMRKAPRTVQGLIFNDNGYIIIENKRNQTTDSGEIQVVKTQVKIELMDAPQLMSGLDMAMEWLTTRSDEIYVPDSNGNPTKISDPLIKIAVPIRNEPTGLTFKPCIVLDNVNVKYQGIAMGNRQRGEICNFTATEFVLFKSMMTYVLNNLYTNNILLTNQAIQYCLYKNFMEVVQNHARTNKS